MRMYETMPVNSPEFFFFVGTLSGGSNTAIFNFTSLPNKSKRLKGRNFSCRTKIVF